jgi:hypothetical protein
VVPLGIKAKQQKLYVKPQLLHCNKIVARRLCDGAAALAFVGYNH